MRLRRLQRAASAEDGVTLSEMLVVMAILGVVLAGLTTIFMGALNSQTDQSNRTQAQQAARLGLDKLRREIRCAKTVAPTSGGYPTSSITIVLGSYCPTVGGVAGGPDVTVTWCTTGAVQPYTLWRYTGPSCSGTGTQWTSNLVDSTSPSVSSGKVFNATSLAIPSLTSETTGGNLASGTYKYQVTAVLSGGAEIPSSVASVTLATTSLTNKIIVGWSAYAGAASYNVYGRGSDGVGFLKNVPSGTVSYVDTGTTSLKPASPATSVTLPSSTIPVADTSNFNSGANAIVFGASGVVTCTGTTPLPTASFTGCTGGQPGQYPAAMPVDSASTVRPPLAALSVTLPLDKTPADTKQRFVLADNIVLRNSRPS